MEVRQRHARQTGREIPSEPDGRESADSGGTGEDCTLGVIHHRKCMVLKFLEGGS